MGQRLAIIGAGDLGLLIAHHAIHDGHYEVAGFLDDFAPVNSHVNGIKIIGKTEETSSLYSAGRFDCLMMGIGYKHMRVRKEKFEKLKTEIPWGRIIHSSSYVDGSATLGDGAFILPGCTVDKGVVFGDNVLSNTGVVVAHDSQIDSHCFLAPSVSVAGKVHIQECCIIGINATIIDNIQIGKGIQVGGGAVVINNLSQPGLYAGVPAVLKKSF